MSKKLSATSGSTQVGRSLVQFSEETSFPRSSLYALPDDQWPEHIKMGRRIIVLEAPAAWLERMKKLQQQKKLQQPAAAE